MRDEPPFGHATDEAVSASIDGELSGFASEHGLTVAEAQDRLERWSGYEDRRRELGRARIALASDPPVLDPSTRRRLVREAGDHMPARRTRRARHAWRPLVAVAAAVLVLVGIGLSLRAAGGNHSSATSKSAAVAPKVQSGAYVGAVGDVSDPAALRMILTTRLAGLPEHANDQAQAPNGAPALPLQPAPSGPGPSNTAATAGGDAALRCASVVDHSGTAGTPDPVILLATATFQSHDAVVVGVRHGARYVVIVADQTTCAVLASQST
ncbi:MAG: hypothetical protein JOZ99_10240 [Actinobacteria bacterium]|nr:hypothetical protein [Actinomycetota bacterium]